MENDIETRVNENWIYRYIGDTLYEIEAENNSESGETSAHTVGVYRDRKVFVKELFDYLDSSQEKDISVNLKIWYWDEREIEYECYGAAYKGILTRDAFKEEVFKLFRYIIDSIPPTNRRKYPEIVTETARKLLDIEYPEERNLSESEKEEKMESLIETSFENYKKDILRDLKY